MKNLPLAVTVLSVLLIALALTGCQSGQQPPNGHQSSGKTPKPPESETGRQAFQKLYPTARMWAADARPFRLSSQSSQEANGKNGKSAIWRCGFASATRQTIKLYMWSGTNETDAPARGISDTTEDTYNPRNSATQPFDIVFLKIDSDQAFDVAQQHGGGKLLKANPNMPVLYVLDWNTKTNQLVWHVMYGGTGLDTKLRVAVDASDGKYLRIEK